jgi:hypothetical protein
MELQATLRFFPCMEVETFAFNDGINLEGEEAGLNSNVHAARADAVWDAHQAWFHTFDAVVPPPPPSIPRRRGPITLTSQPPCMQVVSDTAPMARPFLQGGRWQRRLVLWVANRFDHSNQEECK